jgi:hypothetical protein
MRVSAGPSGRARSSEVGDALARALTLAAEAGRWDCRLVVLRLADALEGKYSPHPVVAGRRGSIPARRPNRDGYSLATSASSVQRLHGHVLKYPGESFANALDGRVVRVELHRELLWNADHILRLLVDAHR